jgi:hypothetical protein
LTGARASQLAYLKWRRAAMLIITMAASASATLYVEKAFFKKPYHTSILSGRMWVEELLQGNPQRIKDQLGMAKHVFRQMVQQLSMRTSANHTRHVGLEEQVAIFLYTIATNLSNRKVAERFQWRGDPFSKYIAPVLSLSC